ncbi:MAG TPA: CopG family transcriptional regulator [Gemmataceae bacterium]|jgi:Arc/MetJ-type ribon-helix-helix transcriptional regulator|nr:CopG family transcriptional regulator [Gemmataceae bacterium]
MKTMTVRLPETLVAEIEAESRLRKVSKSDVVRDRLRSAGKRAKRETVAFEAIADLIGSVDGLPADLSSRKKHYLKETGYGKKRNR